MKKIILASLLCIFFTGSIYAGWSHKVHKNYLYEAISILPYFEYQMSVYYKTYLIEGIVEGEIHHKFNYKDNGPDWFGDLTHDEHQFLCGVNVNDKNVNDASEFFYKQIENLKNEINNPGRRYSKVLFELGYLLCSINNILIPLYEKGHYNEQYYAQNTKSYIELKTNNVEEITDLKGWVRNNFKKKLEMRKEWSVYAENGENNKFNSYCHKANAFNIYTIASIITYVLDGCFGPSEESGHREFVRQKHNKKYEIRGDRRPIN